MPEIESSEQSNMQKTVCFLFFLFWFCCNSLTKAEHGLQPSQSAIIEGINKILLQQYEEALRYFQKITEQYPNHPAGYLYQIATLETRAMDLEYPTQENVFDSLLTRACTVAQTLPHPWREYYLGSADGYRAYHAAEKKEWVGAFRYGSSSASYFESAIAYDSTCYEAYAGLGTYYFWKSQKTSFLAWLPFVGDKRAEGIRFLQIAAEHSEFNRYSAMSSLISIFLETKQYAEAERWATRALNAFPDNRVFLWGKATALDRAQRTREAVTAYEQLLRAIQRDIPAHPYNEIVCRLNLAKAKIALHDTTMVSFHLERILQYRTATFPPSYKQRVQKKFDEAETLLSRRRKQQP